MRNWSKMCYSITIKLVFGCLALTGSVANGNSAHYIIKKFPLNNILYAITLIDNLFTAFSLALHTVLQFALHSQHWLVCDLFFFSAYLPYLVGSICCLGIASIRYWSLKYGFQNLPIPQTKIEFGVKFGSIATFMIQFAGFGLHYYLHMPVSRLSFVCQGQDEEPLYWITYLMLSAIVVLGPSFSTILDLMLLRKIKNTVAPISAQNHNPHGALMNKIMVIPIRATTMSLLTSFSFILISIISTNILRISELHTAEIITISTLLIHTFRNPLTTWLSYVHAQEMEQQRARTESRELRRQREIEDAKSRREAIRRGERQIF